LTRFHGCALRSDGGSAIGSPSAGRVSDAANATSPRTLESSPAGGFPPRKRSSLGELVHRLSIGALPTDLGAGKLIKHMVSQQKRRFTADDFDLVGTNFPLPSGR
jgi:hypothetical protein